MIYSLPLQQHRATARANKAAQHTPAALPSVTRIQQDLATATSIDDVLGKEGIFTRGRVPGLFAGTLEQMREAELTAHLGYEPYAASGRNSGTSRTGERAACGARAVS